MCGRGVVGWYEIRLSASALARAGLREFAGEAMTAIALVDAVESWLLFDAMEVVGGRCDGRHRCPCGGCPLSLSWQLTA